MPPPAAASTIATLPRVTAADLAPLVRAKDPSVAVVDVRDADYLGGHIRGSLHAPSGELDARLPELARQLAGKRTIVFHCMLSQQRGPSAALRFARFVEQQGQATPRAAADAASPTIAVLSGGFQGWVESGHGADASLTSGFRPEVWEIEGDD